MVPLVNVFRLFESVRCPHRDFCGALWKEMDLAWLGLLSLRVLAGPVDHYWSAMLQAWPQPVVCNSCSGAGFLGAPYSELAGC